MVNPVSLGFLELSALLLVTGCMVYAQSDMAHASAVSLSGALSRSAVLVTVVKSRLRSKSHVHDEQRAQACEKPPISSIKSG